MILAWLLSIHALLPSPLPGDAVESIGQCGCVLGGPVDVTEVPERPFPGRRKSTCWIRRLQPLALCSSEARRASVQVPSQP